MSIYIKPSKRGSLHEHLGVPKDKKIPASKLSIKAGDSPAIRKKKQFAINARKWNEYGGNLMMEYGGEIPKSAIEKGTKHELEHTKSKKEAKKIAMDHFKEHGPRYYTVLEKAVNNKLPQYGCGGKLKMEEGGLLPMPEYGFGSWIKENGAGLLKGAGSLVSMIPGIGQIAGPVLSTAGSVIGGIQQKNAQQDAAQAQVEAAEAAEAEKQRVMNLDTRRKNIVDQNQMSYAPTFGLGGNLMINDYTNGNTHQEGVGGIPVDARGNPATTSRSSVVGLTEKGEVTWNGYVFSDKIKIT
jgi:hypothetical protein